MIGKIEIPVGTRIKAMVGGKLVYGVVEEGSDCPRCIFRDCEPLCIATACAGLDRTDFTPVYFKKEKIKIKLKENE